MRRPWLALGTLALALGCSSPEDVAEQHVLEGRRWERRQPSATLELYARALEIHPDHPLPEGANGTEALSPEDVRARAAPLVQAAESTGGRQGLSSLDEALELYLILGRSASIPSELIALRGQLLQQAAAECFDEGERATANGDAQAATRAFRACVAYDPDFPQAAERLRAAKDEATLQIAVLDFTSNQPHLDAFTTSLTDQVQVRVVNARAEFLDVVTRRDLQTILDEQDFNESGLVDPSTAAEVGKLLGCDGLVLGELSEVRLEQGDWIESEHQASLQRTVPGQAERETITATWVVCERSTRAVITASIRLVSVETAQILATDRQTAEATDFVRFARLVDGDPAAVPSDVRPLLDTPQSEPTDADELALSALDVVSARLAASIVEGFR